MKSITALTESGHKFFWRRIINHVSLSSESLSQFRWIYGLYSLILFTPHYSWLADVPPGVFDPPLISVSYLYNEFPHPAIFKIADILCVAFIALITLGIRARIFTGLLLLTKLFSLSFFFSLGKIDHNILENAVLFCMLFSGWGTKYAIVPDKPLNNNANVWTLPLLAIFVCFGMFSAGILKLILWIDFDFTTNGFLTWFYRGYFNLGRTELLAPLVLHLPSPIFEGFDYIAALFEVSGFIFLLISRRWWLVWLMTACLFHLSNTLILNIGFLEHSIVYAAFIRFRIGYLENFDRLKLVQNYLIIFVFLLVIAHILFKIMNIDTGFLMIMGYDYQIIYKLYFGVIIWVALALRLGYELFFKQRSSALLYKDD